MVFTRARLRTIIIPRVVKANRTATKVINLYEIYNNSCNKLNIMIMLQTRIIVPTMVLRNLNQRGLIDLFVKCVENLAIWPTLALFKDTSSLRKSISDKVF